ncbi:MAG: glycosyltransferase family 2 protein [Bdellovibrionales bacterium]|nr:glycosyltransferase family 2 protein [Bdellovibrionales bacterium]
MQRQLTIVIPAYNESENIGPSLRTTLAACSKLDFEYEIIVVDDCSADDTSAKASQFIQQNPRLRVVRNEHNLGYGGAFIRGVFEAKYPSCLMLCADDDLTEDSLRGIIEQVGRADMILTYTANPEVRPLSRQIISKVYTWLLNTCFGYRVRYYNGHNILPTERLKRMRITNGFAFNAQIVIRLLRQGLSYREMPMTIKERRSGASSAFRIKNILSVLWAIFHLFLEKESVPAPEQVHPPGPRP